MSDPDRIVYVSYRLWSEAEFKYHDYLMNCTRSAVDPATVADPPLVIVTGIRYL